MEATVSKQSDDGRVRAEHEEAASRLREQAPEVLRRWETHVRDALPLARDLDQTTLYNNLHEVLTQIADVLVTSLGEDAYVYADIPASQRHAEQRAAMEGYTLDLVIVEYHLLRRAIIEVMEQGEPLPQGVASVIHDGIDRAMQEAAAQLVTERQRRETALRESEARYRRIVETTNEGIWLLDRDARIGWANRHAAAMLGYSADELLGRSLLEFLTPEEQPIAAERFASLRKGHAVQVELSKRHRDGSEVWVTARCRGILDQNGEFQGALSMFTDITERKAAELTLRESEARFRSMADSAPVGIYLSDVNSRGIYLNPTLERLLGMNLEELHSRWVESIHPEDRERVFSTWQAAVEAQQGWRSSHRAVLPDGTVRWLDVQAAPVRERGQLLGYVGMVHDMTEHRQLEQAVRESESRFRAFMDHCPAAAFVKDAEGRLLYVNAAWRRQFSPEPTEWLGMTDFDFWPAESAELFRASDRACVSRGEPIQLEECGLLPATGELRHWLVLKFPLDGSPHSRMGGMVWDVTALKQAEEALQLRDRAIQAATQGIIITDPGQPDDPIIYVNPAFEQLTGYPAAEALGRNCRFLQGRDTDPKTVERLRQAVEAGEACTVELRNYRKDGSAFWNELSISPVRDEDGGVTHFVGVQNDVTQRRQLQSQLLQAQKMEGIGQLAGGIAHDFNNMLAVINGYSEMLLGSMRADSPMRNFVSEINKAGGRAAGLTRQLLAFSRKQLLEPKVLDLNESVRRVDTMLRRLIGEDIELVTLLHPALGRVKADLGQVEQVLINLIVNARDAMPQGGRLLLRTRSAKAAEIQAAVEVKPGWYVALEVEDTGCGMNPEVLEHIFEPFFTTKEPGKGTGLGLATVFGIVKQSGGYLGVTSEPGVGTRFTIYLPQIEAAPVAPDELALPALPSGSETILLVEDEPMVRQMVRTLLTGCGYIVLEAIQGDDALRVAEAHAGPIHLLLTDVVMPRMSGRELAERLKAVRPEVQVLFMSGYTDDAVMRHGLEQAEVELLQKPFTHLALAQRVRRLLDLAQPRTAHGHVLVIDDETAPRETLGELLRDAGYQVTTAAEGQEAFQLLRSGLAVDVILLDLLMPGMNGWVFRLEQGKDPALADIPVVIMSGEQDPAGVVEFLKPAACLLKPLAIEQLLEVCASLCSARTSDRRGEG